MGSVTTWYIYKLSGLFQIFYTAKWRLLGIWSKSRKQQGKRTAEYLANIPKLNDYTQRITIYFVLLVIWTLPIPTCTLRFML